MNILSKHNFGLWFTILSIPFLIFLVPASNVGTRTPRKVAGSPTKTHFDINLVSSLILNNGYTDGDDASPGMFYPAGSGRSAIFMSGIIWGAHRGPGGQLAVGGITEYAGTLQPGKVLAGGTPEDPGLAKNRIYRVRADIPPGNHAADIHSELADGEGDAESIYLQYEKDWTEWPWQDGAPFDDRDHNGIFDPSIDIPGVPGADQTIWYVANDLDPGLAGNLYSGMPLGLEVQMTIWGYRQEGALGHAMFRKALIINKSQTDFDSMYVGLYSDPDVGDPGDDLSGCDTSRSLGFCYNGTSTDGAYNPLPPPAVGFDILQGPVIAGAPSDSGIFLGKRIHGRRNLPMTAFFPFIHGNPILGDPLPYETSEGAPKMYNYMRGLVGVSGQPFVDPYGIETRFPFAGDPELGTGWLDGKQYPLGDRLLGFASGPFTMAPGDTQEVVIATVCGGAVTGSDRLSAIGILKYYDDQVQAAYDHLFALPRPPDPPVVRAIPFDREVVLSWGDDLAAANRTEGLDSLGYSFQGYNIYQLPSASASVEDAKLLKTFDIIDGVTKIQDEYYDPSQGIVARRVKEFGTDSGIRRSLIITDDIFTRNHLVNGTRYYFAVTAYGYDGTPGAIPAALETPLTILSVTPQSPNPGTRYGALPGDTLGPVTRTTIPGTIPCDGIVRALLIDPTRLSGDTYAVTFDTVGDAITWRLTDMTNSSSVLTGQRNQSGDENYPMIDGIQVKVIDSPPGMRGWNTAGTRHWTWSNANGMGLEGFNGAMGLASLSLFRGGAKPSMARSVLIKLAATDPEGSLLDANDTTASIAYRYLRNASATPARPEFTSFISNPSGGYAFQDFQYRIPLAAYDVDADPPRRLAVGFLENNVAGGSVDGKYWPPYYDLATDSTNNTVTTGPREWLFIFDESYNSSVDPALEVDILNQPTSLMWWSTAALRDTLGYAAGDEFRILANHINWPGNTFSFIAPKNTVGDVSLARSDISQITVFPNPYYGVNPAELSRFVRFVTFSHLPQRAVIRIFNVGGVMVKKIDRDNASPFERWDLKNDAGLPVGSGMYIAYIEMPDLGATRIVKLAIVQETQVLDR
jgi:hypothetical protein